MMLVIIISSKGNKEQFPNALEPRSIRLK